MIRSLRSRRQRRVRTSPRLKEDEEDKPKEKKTKKIKEQETSNEELNKTKPIWMRNPTDIKTEEYGAFYKSFTIIWLPSTFQSKVSSSSRLFFSFPNGTNFLLRMFAFSYVFFSAPFDLFETKKKRNNMSAVFSSWMTARTLFRNI
jgi:molecular chaperone HtpG